MNQIFVTQDPSVSSYNATVVAQNHMNVFNNDTVKKCIAKILEYQQALHCLDACLCAYSKKLDELKAEVLARCCQN